MSNRPMTASRARPGTSVPSSRQPPQRQFGVVGGRPSTSLGGGRGRPGTAMGGGRPSTSMSMAGQFLDWAADDNSVGGSPVAPASTRVGSAVARGRLGTAAQAPRTGMARPGTAMAGTPAGGRQLNVTDRTVSRQGLPGQKFARPMTTRSGTAMGNRMVQDKSYFMGLLRAKITDLNGEIRNLNKERDHYDQERQNFIIYEQKAESLAGELKELQGNLADNNLLVDRMTSNTDMSDIQMDVEQMKNQNKAEAEAVDSMFAERRQKEAEAAQMEAELETIRHQTESMLTEMPIEIRDKYENVKQENDQLNEDFRAKQLELEELTGKKNQLEDEVTVSPIKQEAMILHERLAEVENKRDAILAEINSEETPDQKRERLLQNVKKDNEEIATMDKQTTEINEKIDQCNEELKELDEEFETNQGEKNQKYRELRQKEVQIDDFLANFENSKVEEQARVGQFQLTIVKTLNVISKNVQEQDKTAVVSGLGDFDISGTQIRAGNRNSVPELQKEIEQIEDEINRLDEMEERATEELETLKKKMGEMMSDMEKFQDLDSLKASIEDKRKALQSEFDSLDGGVAVARDRAKQIQDQTSQLQNQLNENDAHLQIVNLEKKLQYVEQNNFAVREVIESRQAETNTGPVREQVMNILGEYNTLLAQGIIRKLRQHLKHHLSKFSSKKEVKAGFCSLHLGSGSELPVQRTKTDFYLLFRRKLG